MSAKAREIASADARKHTAASRGFLDLFDVGRMRLGNRHVVGGPRVPTAESGDLTSEPAVTSCRTLSGDGVPRNAEPGRFWALNTRIMHAWHHARVIMTRKIAIMTNGGDMALMPRRSGA